MKFINLHAHSGVGSPFDGFGYPQEHMDFAYQNGCTALALTDHGNMNGLAHQVLHAKKMQAEGKDFKPIYGVEAYFIPSIEEWRADYEEARAKVKNKKAVAQSGTTIEDEEASKKAVKDESRLREEISIMKSLDHPNIVRLVESFEDARQVSLVIEFCAGGQLLDRILEEETFFLLTGR